MQPICESWLDHYLECLNGTRHIRIVSPFITDNMVRHLLDNREPASEMFVITRYNLNDFRSRVSSLTALRKLVENGAHVRGIRALHSKLYLFDDQTCIISSANFTAGGFFNNYEYGIKVSDANVVNHSISYFNRLLQLDTDDLTIEQINSWQVQINSPYLMSPIQNLPDYGKQVLLPEEGDRQYFIKFFGKTDYRVGLDFHTREEIENAHCHFALTFSGKKGRPRKYRTGDIVYMAMMLYGNDYAIFGKGYTVEHNDERDVANEEDIEHVEWKENWPIYIRVYNAEFIDGPMQVCPKMSSLISELDYDAFEATRRRYYHFKETDINTRNIFRQQADVQLSLLGAQWVENKFQEAVRQTGRVPKEYLEHLYQGSYIHNARDSSNS